MLLYRWWLSLALISLLGTAPAAAAEAPPYFAKIEKSDLKPGDVSALQVAEVSEDSPAARAGLEAQDRIIVFDGYRIYGKWELTYIKQFKRKPSTTLPLIVSRRGKFVELLVEDIAVDQVLGFTNGDEYHTWPQILDDLKIAYEPEDVTFLMFQSPRSAVELKTWLDADAGNASRAAWVKSFFTLRKHLANQEWEAARPIPEDIPLPLFRQLAEFYLSVAKRNLKEEQPPDPAAHGVERDFYVFCYPWPRYVPPPLGTFEPSHKAYAIWIKDYVRNPLQQEPSAEVKQLVAEEKRDLQPFDPYYDKLKMAIIWPVQQGGWPVRHPIATSGRPKLIKEMEARRDKHDGDEALYSFALAQLYGMERNTKAMMAEFESLWELSPLLAYRAAVSNHHNLLSAGITWDKINAMEDWRLAHLGPLAPKEPTFFKYVLERNRASENMVDLFERYPGETVSYFYPGNLAIALDHPQPFREEFRALDKAIESETFAAQRRELLQRLPPAVIPLVTTNDLQRLCKLTRDRRGSGLALDAMLQIMENSQDAPGPPFPMVAELDNFRRQTLDEKAGETDAGYPLVVLTLKEFDWKDKAMALANIQRLYEEHGRLAGTAEIAKALREQGLVDEAQLYEARLERAAKTLFPRFGKNFIDSGYAYANLAGNLSASPAMAAEVDRLLRLHKDAAKEKYAATSSLFHVRALLTLGKTEEAVTELIGSYALPKPAAVRPIFAYDGQVTKSDDDYRRWLAKQLAAQKGFTLDLREQLLASPAGKDAEIAKLVMQP